MRYPNFLQKNGTIGFVAPSFGCATEPYRSCFDRAQQVFREQGYGLFLGPNCYEMSGIGISNTPKACGEELTEVYSGDDCDIIISCGGGELMCETLPFTDYEKIAKAKPKWYMGYSDNTNFTFLNTTICDTAAVYGPCVSSFGMDPWHSSLHDAMGLLSGDLFEGDRITLQGYDRWELTSEKDEEHPFLPYHVTEPSVPRGFLYDEQSGQMKEVSELSVKGRLVGGCLDCLANLCGTKHDCVSQFAKKYQKDGILWFIESCDFNPMGMRRALWELREAGWFEHASGFLIGRPLLFGQELMGLDQYHAVLDILEPLQVPVLMDTDIGHLPPALPIISGSIGEAHLKDGRWGITQMLQ